MLTATIVNVYLLCIHEPPDLKEQIYLGNDIETESASGSGYPHSKKISLVSSSFKDKKYKKEIKNEDHIENFNNGC